MARVRNPLAFAAGFRRPLQLIAGDGGRKVDAQLSARPWRDRNSELVAVDEFNSALKAPKTGQSGFAVMSRFVEGAAMQIMWVAAEAFDGNKFTRMLKNEPNGLHSFKMGQSVTAAAAAIDDWIYIEDGKLVGEETIRVFRLGMTPGERTKIDKSVQS